MTQDAITGGPLRVHPANGRYFTDASGRAIYLTGSHTWDQRKQHRIERRRPFPGRAIGATQAHSGATA